MPVSNYSTLMQFLREEDYDNIYIFVVLSKREENNGDLYGFFKKERYEYLHFRSGKRVFFFIPGYENGLRTPEITNKKFNACDFYDTISEFEKRLFLYRYRGGLEMLLIKYNPVKKDIDEREYSVYRLDEITDTYGEYKGWNKIDRFFENVILEAKQCNSFLELKTNIDQAFEKAVDNASAESLDMDDIEKDNYIFISHSRKDRKKILGKIKEALKRIGKDNWDAGYDIPRGYKYAGTLVAAIKKADAILLILSKNSLTSEHVEREISVAVNEHKKICPITLSNYDDFTKYRIFYYYLANLEITNDYADKLNIDELEELVRKVL